MAQFLLNKKELWLPLLRSASNVHTKVLYFHREYYGFVLKAFPSWMLLHTIFIHRNWVLYYQMHIVLKFEFYKRKYQRNNEVPLESGHGLNCISNKNECILSFKSYRYLFRLHKYDELAWNKKERRTQYTSIVREVKHFMSHAYLCLYADKFTGQFKTFCMNR